GGWNCGQRTTTSRTPPQRRDNSKVLQLPRRSPAHRLQFTSVRDNQPPPRVLMSNPDRPPQFPRQLSRLQNFSLARPKRPPPGELCAVSRSARIKCSKVCWWRPEPEPKSALSMQKQTSYTSC